MSGDATEAVRLDERSGCRERIAFESLPRHDEQIYVLEHDPAAAPLGGVVVCSPILVDLLANYPREVHLARALAGAGMSVLRFHNRGAGNSDVPSTGLTLQTLQEDACWARDHLARKLPGVPLGFVGTRWGALAALAAARHHPGAPVVLIEPVTDFSRYFREAMRAKRMTSIAGGRTVRAAKLEDALAEDGYLDIVGDVIQRPLHDSTRGRDALEELRPDGGQALVVQMGGSELRADLAALVERLRATGWETQTVIAEVTESWWFREGRNDQLQTGLSEPVRAWLTDRFETARAPR